MTEAQPRTDAASSWAVLVLTGVAVLAVTLSPFAIAVGRDVWLSALWLDVALAAVAGAMVWMRKGVGCFEMFVPLVATVGVVASTAARPEEVGVWLPVLQVLGLCVVLMGARTNYRRFARDSPRS